MLKDVMKRFLSLVLSAAMIVALIPAMVFDANAASPITGLTDEKIQLSVNDNNGTWTADNTEIEGSVTGTAENKTLCVKAASKETTLTIMSRKPNKAQLTFDYNVTLNDGMVEFNGESMATSGTFQTILEEDGTVAIHLKSAVGGSTTSIKITNISLVVDANVTMTFLPAENGSYTVNGDAITGEKSNTQNSKVPYELKATPATGYKFVGWYDTENKVCISYDASTTQYFEGNTKLTAIFEPTSTPVFESNRHLFTDLGDAVSWAQENSAKKITLVSNGTVSGSYTIPNGITLLIPFDNKGTLYTKEPATTQSYTTPSAYRTLTMADGASITVDNGGAISLGSKMSATGTGSGSYSGTPSGSHGKIQMNSGSEIVLNSGANLYAWGYVAGNGTVTAKSGANVYEMFQLRDFRGGQASLGMSSKAVFPMNQYYVQNVEAKLVFEAGAKETVATALTMSGSTNQASAEFIGSKGMFQMGTGTTMSKTYDPKTDRLLVDVNGDATISSISLSLGGASINSANYPLPINSNITINIHSGTATVNQDLDLFPGSVMTVDSGAAVNIQSGKNVYVYDKDQWGNYAAEGAQIVPIGYTAAAGKAPGIRGVSSLIDAKIDVNGTVTVNGGFYTTESGADIVSTKGTGKINFAVAAGTKKSDYQVTQSGTSTTQVSIPITPAKLHNGAQYAGTEEEYTQTKDAKAGDAFNYDKNVDKWKAPAVTFTVTFDKNADDAEGTMEPLELTSGEEGTLTKNAFTREGYEFAGWDLSPDGGVMSIPDEYTGVIPAAENITLYAQWKKVEVETHTVIWKNADGTVLETDENVAVGTMPEYNGETPVMDDAQYTYTFTGWDKELAEVTEDVTYTAVYSTETKTYTVTWQDADGSVLETDEGVPYGTVPTYDGAEPSKSGDVQFSYTFKGWTPEVSAVTGNTTYVASYEEKTNSYTVTWLDEDGTVLEKDENVPYGTVPTYDGKDPEKAATEEESYTFNGWEPNVVAVTGDATYKATYSAVKNAYTVTWVNDDGTVLEKDEEVEYGTKPSYDGKTPTKESTAQYSYTFKGWTPEVSTVTGNVTYTATYTQKVRSYTVTWKDADGTVLKTDTLEYGATPAYGSENPTREMDDQYIYTFKGWTPAVAEVTGDAEYTAEYDKENRNYTVIWKNADGTVLETDADVPYGTMASYDSEEPAQAADAQYTYTFKGWDKEPAAVTGDVVYTAVYTETLNTYTVIWKDEDGTVLETDEEVPYGAKPTYDGEKPAKENNDQYTWKFTGWTPEIANVTGDVVYTAVYSSTVNTYTVKWMLDEDTVLEVDENVPYGTKPNYNGKIPEKADTLYYSYEFAGWSLDEATVVTGDTCYYAVFSETEKSGWTQFEGKQYFIENGEVVTGLCLVTDPEDETADAWFVFDDETGAFCSEQNGLYKTAFDTFWTEDGRVIEDAGLVRVVTEDGEVNYYYFGEDGKAVRGTEEQDHYVVEKNNGLDLPEGINYTFGEDGVIKHFEDTSINGIYYDESSDNYYFCVDGVIIANGLMLIDGKYYYARTSTGAFVRSRDYWITLTHDLLPEGIYTFDNQGRIQLPEETEPKNGIVAENGSLYYYVDDVITPAGLIQIDGDYYYVRTSNGEVVHGRSYWVTKTNDLPVPDGTYAFDESGKMIDPPVIDPDADIKDGIVAEKGSLYYYVNGVLSYAGLIQIDGDYYYVRTSSGEVVHGRSYWVAATNGLPVPEGTYTFDENGKMVNPPVVGDETKNGIVAENGSLFYYVDGKITPAGLIEIDGDYYYVRTSNGEVVHGRSYWVTKTNGLPIAEGSYTFADDGKMIR